MIKNYLKTGFRNLFRHKGYAIINIVGLAVGIASCLLISMFVRDEYTFDRYHTKASSIYNLSIVLPSQGQERVLNAVSYPEPITFYEEIPEIVNFSRLRKEGAIVRSGEDVFDEKGLMFSDRGFFEMFDFNVLDGALDDRLASLESVVLTESSAIKYFGTVEAAGKELTAKIRGDFEQFIVTAVIEDHPSNSSFSFNMMMSWNKFETILDAFTKNLWAIAPAVAFVQLDEKADVSVVQDKMKKSRDLHNKGEETFDEIARKNHNKLIPLVDYHFEKQGGDEKRSQSGLLAGIAILILVIAGFNFSILTIVNSISRAKEVGVRKTIGATRKNLVYQFLTEALILCAISFLIGVILAELVLPLFENVVEKQFSFNLLDDQFLLLTVLAFVLIVSLLSVLYPSVYLSRIQAIKVFRENIRMGGRHVLTKSMVTLQFLCAFIFITVSVAITQQHKFLMKRDRGYNDENLIRLKIPNSNSLATVQRFKNELSKDPNIVSIGAASDLNEALIVNDGADNRTSLVQGDVDLDYLQTMEIKLLEGRSFNNSDLVSLNEESAGLNVIVNESALKELGIDENSENMLVDGKYRVIGIMQDYQIFSANSPMSPLMLKASNWSGGRFSTNNIYLRYRENNLTDVLETLETAWADILPLEPYQYTFVDEYNRSLYKKESIWSKTLTYSSSLTIIISLMGLFGLVGLSASQRKKEVSIRKVLGASVSNLVLLLNQGFTRLLMLSMLLSVPIAYYIINRFLQGYINRIEITAMLFALPLLVTFLVAWLTVSSITLRSANGNPIDELRNE
ncbi:MAG: ABC transporter permease [Rhodobacteraceae bacterium]|nr:ABC transporter permease [Paracoccaceae bacterium]